MDKLASAKTEVSVPHCASLHGRLVASDRAPRLPCMQDVREMWAGLGYYSRGQRLLEGAKKVHGSHVQLL